MLIRDAVTLLDGIFPLALQQPYDRCGFQCGNASQELRGILVGLDVSQEMIEEAVGLGCNLLVTHHPLLFHPLKTLGTASRVERLVHQLLGSGLVAYAAHTNADALLYGVNGALAEALGLVACSVLEPSPAPLMQTVVYVPTTHVEEVRDALFEAGAGALGSYREASFGVRGMGTFKPVEGAQPHTGQLGVREVVEETRLEVVFESWRQGEVQAALRKVHPYEEIAQQLYALTQTLPYYGMGLVGDFEEPLPLKDCLQRIREVMGCPLRHSHLDASATKSPVVRMGLCGGAGADLWTKARSAGAQVFLSSEFKHHHFLDAGSELVLVEAGHAETEIPACGRIQQLIAPKFRNFAVLLTRTNSRPASYLCS